VADRCKRCRCPLVLLRCADNRQSEPAIGFHRLAYVGEGRNRVREELESFVIAESAAAWAALIEMDRERGGTGELHDTAVSLMRGRTMIAVHCDYHDDDRTLTAWFKLPEPLPGRREFILDLHDWLEGRQAAPKLLEPDASATLH
jgi:hypothetical protein